MDLSHQKAGYEWEKEKEPLQKNQELEPLNKDKMKQNEKQQTNSTFRPIILGILLSCASNFQIGYSVTFMNTPVEEFKRFLNQSTIDRGQGPLTESQYDWIWNVFLNVWFVGFGLGLLLNPYFNDKIGRKKGFLMMSVLSLSGSILRFISIVTEIYEFLLLGQFVAALAVAVCYQSLILMLQECAPTKLRGLLSCSSEVCVALFCVFGTFIGMKSVFGENLRLLVGAAIIPGILAIITLFPMHESPKFLLIFKRDKIAAIKSIRYYHGENADVNSVIEEIEKESIQETKSKSSFLELFYTPHLRKAIFLGCLALQLTTALWVLFFSSTYFLQQVHIDDHFANLTSTALVCLYLIGSIFASIFVDRFGRRKLLLPASFVSLLFLTAYVVCAILQPTIPWLKYGCVVSLYLYIVIYGFGTGPICWFLCAELVPQRNRSRVQVFCYFLNMLICIVLTSCILPLYKLIGPSSFLVLYVLPCSFAWVILYLYLPETKGREIHEIVAELKHESTKETVLLDN